jgi:predicted nucleotidyltransferase
MPVVDFGERLRRARIDAGLTQARLAKLAGTSQARVSSYERGSVVPSRATQERLLRAARPLPSAVLARRRAEVKALAARHGLSNVRVFGSVARGTDTVASDVDLLVTPSPGTTFFGLAAYAVEVEDLLGCEVDVVSDRALAAMPRIAGEAVVL